MITALTSRLRQVLGKPALWPLWGILVIGAILLLGRCSADPQVGATSSVVTVTKTVTAPPRAGGGTSGATPYAGGAGGTGGTLTRGPGGAPITATDRSVARCDVDRLPAQARVTIDLVRAGGPFPYPRNDTVTFRNSERRLPNKPEGYYREYTVITPGESSREMRRIVTGGDPPTQPKQWYYTGDHYDTFCQVTGLG